MNGDLQEEVYMTPPLSVSHDYGYVCKLKKALYSLKQAPCGWFEKFSVMIFFLKFVLVVIFLLFLLRAPMQVVSLCLYMLMTWLLLVMTLMAFQFWRQSWLDSLKWRIWLSSIFFRYWGSLLTQRLSFFFNRNMLQIFFSGLELLIIRL